MVVEEIGGWGDKKMAGRWCDGGNILSDFVYLVYVMMVRLYQV